MHCLETTVEAGWVLNTNNQPTLMCGDGLHQLLEHVLLLSLCGIDPQSVESVAEGLDRSLRFLSQYQGTPHPHMALNTRHNSGNSGSSSSSSSSSNNNNNNNKDNDDNNITDDIGGGGGGGGGSSGGGDSSSSSRRFPTVVVVVVVEGFQPDSYIYISTMVYSRNIPFWSETLVVVVVVVLLLYY